jgi:hypothetical protein
MHHKSQTINKEIKQTFKMCKTTNTRIENTSLNFGEKSNIAPDQSLHH